MPQSKTQLIGSLKAAAKAKMIRNARKSRVEDLLSQGVSKEEVIEIMGLSRQTINTYLRS